MLNPRVAVRTQFVRSSEHRSEWALYSALAASSMSCPRVRPFAQEGVYKRLLPPCLQKTGRASHPARLVVHRESQSSSIPSKSGYFQRAVGQSQLVGTRHIQYLVADECLDEVVVDWRDLVHARFAEFTLNVVLVNEAVAAVGIEADIRCFPACFRGQVLGHVRFSANWSIIIR